MSNYEAPIMSDKKQEQKYQAEDDERTLTRVKEIEADPGRMRRALTLIETEVKNKGKVRLDLKKMLRNKS